ncbi:MAG: class I SAM-dependent methyltransferase [Thaumarchaeota archaeon]|nr:class I SAM-dependent methyltransferase [Nitrososphaerota archaeon]
MEPASDSGPGLRGTAIELFGGLARTYERALDLATLLQDRRWKSWVVGHAQAGRSDKVLDVGCGTLILEERLRAEGCEIVGVDITGEMLRVGHAKKLPNIAGLALGDAESLPFADSSFDVVASCYVAKYVDFERFARELARVVRPGGRVVLYDFVRPRGSLSPVLRVYLHGVLGAAGLLLGLAKSDAAFTFRNLPRIVESAVWDRSLDGVMAAAGLKELALERLTGGAVVAYCGRRP